MKFNPKDLIVPVGPAVVIALIGGLVCFVEGVVATETIKQARNVPCVATTLDPAAKNTIQMHIRCPKSDRGYYTYDATVVVERLKHSGEMPVRCTLYRHKNEVDCTLRKGG